MSALDFPNTPSLGQVATLTNGIAYRWDGAVWTAGLAIPTTLPPSGTAGGDLAGTYPNPDIKALAVGTPELAAGAVTDAKVTDVAWAKITGAPTIPTSLPPSGAASGDLSGTYPAPQLAAGVIVDADVSASAAIQYTKLTGVPTALPGPPTGAASGDLTGTYPGPTVAKLNGATVGTTTPLARGDLFVANATPALVRLARGTVNQVLQSDGTDVVWGPAPATGGPPTGSATGDLSGSYPSPQIAAGVIVDADVSATAAIQYSKLTGTPTALPGPPTGAAGGDLAGSTYPNPVVAAGAITKAKLAADVAQLAAIDTATPQNVGTNSNGWSSLVDMGSTTLLSTRMYRFAVEGSFGKIASCTLNLSVYLAGINVFYCDMHATTAAAEAAYYAFAMRFFRDTGGGLYANAQLAISGATAGGANAAPLARSWIRVANYTGATTAGPSMILIFSVASASNAVGRYPATLEVL